MPEGVAKTAIAYHEKYAQYDLGPGHPYRGDRFPRAWEFFKKMGLLERPEVVVVRPEPAGREDLLRVHSESHVSIIKALSRGVDVKVVGSFGVGGSGTSGGGTAGIVGVAGLVGALGT